MISVNLYGFFSISVSLQINGQAVSAKEKLTHYADMYNFEVSWIVLMSSLISGIL